MGVRGREYVALTDAKMRSPLDTAPTSTFETYHTTDLYLGAFLKARGMKLLDRRLDGRRVTFVFEDRPDRKQLVLEFYANGQVRANDFVHALQDLKAVVYNL